MAELSPMMAQYFEIKKQHKDEIAKAKVNHKAKRKQRQQALVMEIELQMKTA